MDRPIAQSEIRGRRARRLGLTLGVVLLATVLFVLGRSWIRPSVPVTRIRIAPVERGDVEATLLASGTIVAGAEQSLVSPFAGRLSRVHEEAGATLAKGQPVVALESDEVQLDLDRLGDELALLRNRRQRLELQLGIRLEELESQRAIQNEKLTLISSRTKQHAELHREGLASAWDLKQSELDERVARIELEHIERQMERERSATRSELDGLDIEMQLLVKDLDEKRALLARSTIRAPRAGVLTWVDDALGTLLPKGSVVARVADLSRFGAEATLPAIHSGKLHPGLLAHVTVARARLTGRVRSVAPEIDDGATRVTIDLEHADHSALRANLRVDVHLVLERKPDVLRVAKGPFATGPGPQQVFVVREDELVRRDVVLGVSGVDHYEILRGLEIGDEVVVSDMQHHIHRERLALRGSR